MENTEDVISSSVILLALLLDMYKAGKYLPKTFVSMQSRKLSFYVTALIK